MKLLIRASFGGILRCEERSKKGKIPMKKQVRTGIMGILICRVSRNKGKIPMKGLAKASFGGRPAAGMSGKTYRKKEGSP